MTENLSNDTDNLGIILKEIKSSPSKYSRVGASLDRVFRGTSVEGIYTRLEEIKKVKDQERVNVSNEMKKIHNLNNM